MKKAIGLILLCTVFTSTGQLLLKKGALGLDFGRIITFFNWPLFGGIVFYGVGFLLMLAAFKRGDLSVLYPILASSYIWVSLLSPFFFNDSMNLWKWVGVFLIILSVGLLGYGSDKHG